MSVGGQDLSQYLVKFNASDWANQANAQLQQSLAQGMQYGEKYTQKAIDATQAYGNQASAQLNQGFQQSQALNAPKQMATYNALDAYQSLLGLPTPVGGSYNMARSMEGQATGVPVPVQTQQYQLPQTQQYQLPQTQQLPAQTLLNGGKLAPIKPTGK